MKYLQLNKTKAVEIALIVLFFLSIGMVCTHLLSFLIPGSHDSFKRVFGDASWLVYLAYVVVIATAYFALHYVIHKINRKLISRDKAVSFILDASSECRKISASNDVYQQLFSRKVDVILSHTSEQFRDEVCELAKHYGYKVFSDIEKMCEESNDLESSICSRQTI